MNEIRPLYRYNPLTKQQEMVYPKTHINAVVTEDGKSITELINELNAATVEQITQIIQNAPQEYDTLLEIATALNANRDSIATILQAIGNKQDKLNYTAENTANKGVPNGYAGLDASGKVPNSQLPEAQLANAYSDGLMPKEQYLKVNSIPADNVKRSLVMTQASYDALSTAEKERTDTLYFISG